jgi:hypothetical protein
MFLRSIVIPPSRRVWRRPVATTSQSNNGHRPFNGRGRRLTGMRGGCYCFSRVSFQVEDFSASFHPMAPLIFTRIPASALEAEHAFRALGMASRPLVLKAKFFCHLSVHERLSPKLPSTPRYSRLSLMRYRFKRFPRYSDTPSTSRYFLFVKIIFLPIFDIILTILRISLYNNISKTHYN